MSETATMIEKPTRLAGPIVGEQRIVLYEIDWETYQLLAEAIGDQPIRLAYNCGVLELMSPGPIHENYKSLIGRLIWLVTMELGIPCRTWGSTRWDRPEARRGIEADECYYLTRAKLEATRHRPKDAADYPAPDLAIEVDISPSKVDRPSIYAALGVPEVWRFDGEALRIDRLGDDGTYAAAPESRLVPVLPSEVVYWLLEADPTDESIWGRQVQAWARATVLPRHRAATAGPGAGAAVPDDRED